MICIIFINQYIKCNEMNHYENAFNLEISLYWNYTELQTLVFVKINPKDKIIKEIMNRELNDNDKKIIYENICNSLFNDLNSVENILTSLIFSNMKDICLYLKMI